MDITGKTALVTGANRGLGRQLAAELRDRGARVYAAARDPQAVDLAGVTPIALDITDPASVAAAAQAASGVAILVNNAGSSTGSSLLTGDLAAIRLEMDTHFFGTLAVTRAFAPQLAAHPLDPRQPGQHRAARLPAPLTAGYAGVSLPVIGVGIMLQHFSPRVTLLIFAVAVAIVILAAAPILTRPQKAAAPRMAGRDQLADTTETTLADTAHAKCMDELCTAHGMPASTPMNCRVTRSVDHASGGELH